MKIKDMLSESYYDPARDQSNIAHKTDTHRPKLTLRHLNKLRKYRELKRIEQAEHARFVARMYGPSNVPQE